MRIEELSGLIQRTLKRSRSVEIDGLGVFARDNSGDISFQHSNSPRIFIAYAAEDRQTAERLYEELEGRGFSAWLDRRKLLPGQNWPRRIEDAIVNSDFFIACFSRRSVRKRGGFQVELHFALECAHSMPLDQVFLIPVRLDECDVPARIERETHFVDLFPEWEAGLARVIEIIERQTRLAA